MVTLDLRGTKIPNTQNRLSINPIVGINCLGPESHSYELGKGGREYSLNQSSQISAKGQPCKQVL